MKDNGEPKRVKITINGRELEVPAGYPVIQAALDHGIMIPHYCYHPDIGIDGNCRMCLGELEGAPKLVPTCTLRAADGMVVRTDTARVKEAVRGILEFILLNHPIDCPICDQAGECKLQDYYMEFGMHRSRQPLADKVHKQKVVDLGPIVLDAERCVLCSRCTRFTDHVSGTHELRFRQRGNHTEITTFDGAGVGDGYSGNLADLCPVGALTSHDFRFRKRVWFLDSASSVCDGCATGCSIRIDYQQGDIYRYVPRRNSWVNASWMCDAGRMSYKGVGRGRLTMPLLRGDDGTLARIPWEKALGVAARRIREARQHDPAAIFAVAAPVLATEELYLFGRFAREILTTPNLDYRVSSSCERPEELEDGLLRRRDCYPNSRGAEVLGLGPGTDGTGVAGAAEVAAGVAGVAGRWPKLVYLVGADRLTGDRLDIVRGLADAAETVIVHAARECELLALADLVLPVAMTAEKQGTFVNHDGRLQRFARTVPPPGEAEPDGEVLCLVAEKLEQPLGVSDPRRVLAEIAAAVPAFAGVRWDEIPATGVQLAGFAHHVPRVTEISVAPQPAP